MKHKRPEPDPEKLEAVLFDAVQRFISFPAVLERWPDATTDNFRYAPAEVVVALLIEQHQQLRDRVGDIGRRRRVAENAVRAFTDAAQQVLAVVPPQDALFEEVSL